MEEQENLKDRLRKEVSALTEKLKSDPSTLAVILTGPLAVGKALDTDKLYLAVITDKEDGIIEHHFLDDGWDEVGRPVEMGKFPLSVARYLVEHGYGDIVSYKSLEAFRCGEVLWEKQGIGEEIVSGSKRHIPSIGFVGESLHGAVSALDDAVSLLKNGDYANAVLVAREAAVKAVGMVIQESMKKSGLSFMEAAKQVLPPEQYELCREIMDLKNIDSSHVGETVRQAREFAEYTLREIGVDPQSIIGLREKEPPV